MGLPWWLSSKESICSAGDAGDVGSVPGSGRSPGEGNGNPCQYPCCKEPGQLQSMGSQRVRHNWSNWAHTQPIEPVARDCTNYPGNAWFFLTLWSLVRLKYQHLFFYCLSKSLKEGNLFSHSLFSKYFTYLLMIMPIIRTTKTQVTKLSTLFSIIGLKRKSMDSVV